MNDPPIAINGDVLAFDDAPVASVTLLASDPDRTVPTCRILVAPERGWLTDLSDRPLNVGDAFDSTLNALYHLPVPEDCKEPEPVGTNYAMFVWTATDEHGATSIATNFIHVEHRNYAPLPAGPSSLATLEDTPAEFSLSGSDADGDEMLIRILTLPAHGTLEFLTDVWRRVAFPGNIVAFGQGGSSNVTFRYVPGANYYNDNRVPDSFTWTLQDRQDRLARCGPRTVSLWVTNVPDAPAIVTPWTITTAEDTPVSLQLPIIDPDLEHGGDTIQVFVAEPVPCIFPEAIDCLGLLYQVENDDVTRGALIDQPKTLVTHPRGLVMFVPQGDRHGTTACEFQLEDNHGSRSAETVVLLAVTPVNDAPTAASRAVQMRNTDPFFAVTPFVSDVDSGPTAGRLTTALADSPNTNDWLLENTVTWAYYPPIPDDCAEPIPTGTNIASYRYLVRDPAGATAEAREQIDIVDVNIPPVPTWPVAVTNR